MTEFIDIDQAKKILLQEGYESTGDVNLEGETKFSLLQREKNQTQLDLKERIEVIRMRGVWSYWLLGVIVAIVFFDFVVILAVGFKWIIFDKSYIVPFFVGESLIKTLGLALIVVRFLFNEKFISKSK